MRDMLWTIAAPFFVAGNGDGADRWIDDFVPVDTDRFRKIGPPARAGDWHARASRATPLGEWRRHWRQAGSALAGTDGLVTVFPQLALTAALRRDLAHRHVPIVAWCFNVGAFPTGAKGSLAALALRRIERFVVHSTAEVGVMRDWLGLPAERVQYVPLQCAPIPSLEAADLDRPFAVAMGSANRDYATLFEAARLTGLPVTVVAAPRAIEGLSVTDNVTLLTGLDREQCWRLAQRARFSVVPLADTAAASGQVTLLEAMRMHRPVIATRSAGTVDYIADGESGLLVEPGEPQAMADAMTTLWHDGEARRRLADRAAADCDRLFSDAAAGRSLSRILAEARAARS